MAAEEVRKFSAATAGTVIEQVPNPGTDQRLNELVSLMIAEPEALASPGPAGMGTATNEIPPGNPIPNFAGTWEVVEETYNGQKQTSLNGRRVTITQVGSLVRFSNSRERVKIDRDGRAVRQSFVAHDSQNGHEVNTLAEADLVDTFIHKLEGPNTLIFETNFGTSGHTAIIQPARTFALSSIGGCHQMNRWGDQEGQFRRCSS